MSDLQQESHDFLAKESIYPSQRRYIAGDSEAKSPDTLIEISRVKPYPADNYADERQA
jgi:hypothetical protein